MASDENDGENEIVFISQIEFANIVEDLDVLKQFSGRHVVNKFEIVVEAVVRWKYENNVRLDFENCSTAEKSKLRCAYNRIEKKIRTNSKRKKNLSYELENKAFISSDQYKTLIISLPHPPSSSSSSTR